MPTRISTLNPKHPIWNEPVKKELRDSVVPFDITAVSQFRSPRYGPTWRLTVRRRDTGEIGMMLFAGNDVRDDTYGAIRDAVSDNDTVGPCILVSTQLPNSGRTTWEIEDAPDEAVTKKK